MSTWDGQGAEAATATRTHTPIGDRSSALGQPPSATQTLRTGRSRSARGGCSRPVAAPANMVAFVQVLEGRNGRVRAGGDPFSFFIKGPLLASAEVILPGLREPPWRRLQPAVARVRASRGQGAPGTITGWVMWFFFPSLSPKQVKARPSLPLSSRAKARSSRASRRAGLRQKPELQRAEKDLGIPRHRLQAGSGPGP